jgi:hypothetical protein
MTPAETAIRARRKLTNKLIAAHEADRLRPFLDPKMTLIAGDGSVISGASAVVAAFDAQFADPDFVTYLRTTDGVEIDSQGERAAERGSWAGTWRSGASLSGTYLAVWKKVTGQWVLEAELYVTLG